MAQGRSPGNSQFQRPGLRVRVETPAPPACGEPILAIRHGEPLRVNPCLERSDFDGKTVFFRRAPDSQHRIGLDFFGTR